jgi:glycosyltransferase involved in cell wall biosynthesis
VKPAVAFVWENFGPYHVDRLEAAGSALGVTHRVIGIEIAGSSGFYAWDPTAKVSGFERMTLFPDRAFNSISPWRRWSALLRAAIKTRAKHVFLCHVPLFDMFLLAAALRLMGRRVYAMTESKFDDKPRALWFELLKRTLYLPYAATIVGGSRHAAYMRFLGFRPASIFEGYDTVSGERVRRLAGAPPAPLGAPHDKRHFTIIARLVPKKNIAMALEAYAQYRREAGANARDLCICGSGELEDALRRKARDLGLPDSIFRGFIQAPDIARILATSLALILPSTEEQWGLVVNEAVAMGVPILCSTNTGARDLLVRTGVNGFLFEPDNPAGLAYFMQRLAGDEAEWRSLAEGSLRLAPLADTRNFGAAVLRAVRGEAAAAAVVEPGRAVSSDLPP